MSEMGEANGHVASASEFRGYFLNHGLKFDNFACPFCGITLVAKAIYAQGKQGRSPYFSCKPREDHILGCNGWPFIDKQKKNEIIGRSVFIKKNMSVPEELVMRPTYTSQTRHINTVVSLTEEIVNERRRSSSYQAFLSKYSSRLIRAFSEAWTDLMIECYKSEKNYSKAEFRDFIKSKLSAHPLKLLGKELTYHDAFRDTRHPDWVTGNYIYHGKGIIEVGHSGFIISSNVDAEYKQNSSQKIENIPVKVEVNLPLDLNELAQYHRCLYGQLKDIADSGNFIKWFALGEMKPVGNPLKQYTLEVSNLDWLYVK